MVKDYQLDPVKGNLIHTDLLEIAMDRLLELSVNVEIVGEAEGVKLDGGLMDIVTRSIDVECLPSDIPDSIKVDVTALKINDYIRVKNLPDRPEGEDPDRPRSGHRHDRASGEGRGAGRRGARRNYRA